MADIDVCPWPIEPGCCDGWSDYSEEVRAAATQMATEILWMLSGRIFSECPVTIRPCRRACARSCDLCAGAGMGGIGYGGLPFVPALLDGQWYNLSCPCEESCSCGANVDQIELPGPVARVAAVYLDGAPFTDWSLWDRRYLMRTDGEMWPRCQDLTKDLTAEGTWGVAYVRGSTVPIGGRRAAGVLACEFARACTGNKQCRIPAQVTQVTRDGVSWTFDPTVYYTAGLTGIPEVDLWLSAVNRAKSVRPPGVYSPDLMGRDRVRTQPREVTP